MTINWFAVTVCVIWMSGSIAAAISKKADCLLMTALTTIAMGFGYFLLHDK